MKKSLPFLSPYLMLTFPLMILLGLTLMANKNKMQHEFALENTFSKSEQIAQGPKITSHIIKHLLKK